MRPSVVALLALLLAPLAAGHGASGLHLEQVRLAYDPLLPGQTLTFVVENERDVAVESPRAHVAIREATSRTTHPLAPIPPLGVVAYTLPMPARLAPQACLVVTASGMASEEVCALATALPAAPALPQV